MQRISLDQLLKIKTEGLKESETLELIGNLFDQSMDDNDVRGIDRGLELASTIQPENLSNEENILFNYFLANGWESKRYFNNSIENNNWDFEQQELSKELFHLRKCLTIEGFDTIHPERQCQIYTNLGNQFSHVGRFVEAQEYWKLALEIHSDFPMALGNIAKGLFHYAECLHEQSHQNIFIYQCHKYIIAAIKQKKHIHPSAFQAFNQLLKLITRQWSEKYLNTEQSYSYDLGKNQKLKQYREWGIENILFLNPLNDLGALEMSSHDCLHLPSMTVPLGEKPKYHALFNQIKQEYGTARFLFYEGTQLPIKSYSDKDIVLVETMDYAEYSYNLEKIKIAYRLIYSLFDKIAYLLNDYLEIGVPKNRISFRALWNDDKKKLRTQFIGNQNYALRGLYWLSKDFFDKDEAHTLVIEPEAKELADIRNYIEHKSFKITQYGNWGEIEDDYTFVIGREEFEHKTFKQLKLIRAAIIYTSLAIHHEEKGKSHKYTIPMYLPDMPYEYKI